jgi:hypothetical protein
MATDSPKEKLFELAGDMSRQGLGDLNRQLHSCKRNTLLDSAKYGFLPDKQDTSVF